MANSIGLVDGNVITASVPVAATAGQVLSSNGTTLTWTTPTTGTVTGLTGEVTTTGSGLLNVTLSNLAVISKTLSGLSVSSGAITSADSILTAMGKIQGQINGLAGGSTYKGTWNAATNTPTIVSSVGTGGDYYIVSTAGTTNINGTSSWDVGDWIIFDGTVWQKVDNTDSVTSVNGQTGAVNLTTTNISEGTNLYYTDTRARAAISLTTTGSSGASTYTSGVLNIPSYTLSGLGGVPTTTTLNINGTSFDLSANRSWSVGTVTSVNATVPTGFSVGSPVTSSGNIAITFATGYSLPTNALQANWDAAYNLTLGAALTKTDDTNVTLTLGGTPATSLLRATSLTLGWNGQLAVGRGGSGASTLTGILVGNDTSAFTGVTGTANQLLRRNAANTAYEFFTPSFTTGSGTVNNVSKWTSATGLGDSQIIDNGTNVGIGISPTSKLTVNGSVELRNGGGVIQTNSSSSIYMGTLQTDGTPIGAYMLAAGNNSLVEISQRGGVEVIYSTQNLGEGGFNVFAFDGTINTRYLKVSRSGNLMLQNGGVYTDTTERLQVGGTAKITGATSIGGDLTVTGKISAGSGPSDFSGTIRTTNSTVPTAGSGLEIGYLTGTSTGVIVSYNRGTPAYNALSINASTLNLNTGSNGTVNFGTGNVISTSGKFRLGSTPGTTGYINIGINNTTGSQFNLATSGFTPATPVNGDGWFDGTSIKFRISGSTTNFITGDLTSGYIPKATGVSSIANSLIYDNSVSVLVNTNTAIPVPGGGTYSHVFQILANAAGGMIISTDDDSSAIGIVNSASSNKTWDISPFGADLVINESGIAPRLKFKAGGNIEAPVLAGTGTRMVVADATGVLSTQAIPTGNFTGTLATGQVAFGSNTNTIAGSNSLFWDAANGKLGIGTDTPSKVLSANGSVILGGTTTHANDATNTITLNGITSFANGNIRVDGTNVITMSTTSWVFASAVALTSNGITGYSSSDFNVSSGATTQAVNLRVASSTYLKVAPTTGNILIQNGGTYTDNLTDRLQVIGSSSFTGNGIFNGKLTASNSVPTTGFPTTNTVALFGGQTLNIPAGTIGLDGVIYAAGTSAQYMRFNGNTTMDGDALFAGKVVLNSVQFDTTGTVTMANSGTGGTRALSALQIQMQFAGTTSGTVTNGASLFIQGIYPNNTAGTVTFNNYYGLRISNLLEWNTGAGAGKVAIVNRWGIFQAGPDDINYFAASVGIGTSIPVPSAKLEVSSTTQGFLPPRMTTVQMNAIGTPTAGLIIFNTTDNKHYGYNGTTWVAFY